MTALPSPPGSHTALRVAIGEGQGQNWWCVAFPPLCLEAASETVDEAAAAGYLPGQAALITEEDRGYVLKVRAMELLGSGRASCAAEEKCVGTAYVRFPVTSGKAGR